MIIKVFVYQERSTQRGYKPEGTRLVHKDNEVMENTTLTEEKSLNSYSLPFRDDRTKTTNIKKRKNGISVSDSFFLPSEA